MTPRAGRLLAAVDLGSNSFHMVVARHAGGGLHVLDRLRDRVALAAGLDDEQRLSREAQQRALDCLARFGERLRDIPASCVRAVGTNTLRVAQDARDFLPRCEKALGHRIEIVSGLEEARLVYLGVVQSLGAQPGLRRLVVDVGGGSTECVIGEGAEPLEASSLFMGCVTFTQRHFPGGVATKRRMQHAVLAARLELAPIERRYRELGWSQAVGSSGTVLAVEELLREAGWSQGGIPREGLRRLREAIETKGHPSRLGLTTLAPDRAGVLAAGVAILSAVFEALGPEIMMPSSGALREGLLHDLVGRMSHADAREHGIEVAWERWHVDVEQARRVEREALLLLRSASGGKPPDQGLRRALSWAARLHEAGLSVAWPKHHEHGAYLVRHAHLPGFSRDEQELVAALIAAHRRKLQPEDLASQRLLPVRDALRLAVLLRLAVRLHRSRSPRPLPRHALQARGSFLTLKLPARFLAKNPLTREDLEEEAKQVAAAGIRLKIAPLKR